VWKPAAAKIRAELAKQKAETAQGSAAADDASDHAPGD
jgi:hypothetical protein